MYDPIHNKSTVKDLIFPGAILLVGILISVGIFLDKNGTLEKSSPSAILPIDTGANERVNITINSNDPILGNPQAPVTLVEFFDFQCGYCKSFAEQTLPKIIDSYIKTGEVKVVFKDFAILGDDSKSAAIAANCANEQTKYLEYHDKLYKLKDDDAFFTNENLLAIANELKLNIFKFNDCMGLNKNKTAIEEDAKEGKLAGVRGTPTIFINGLKVPGAQSFSYYKSIIDQELKNNQ